MRFALPSIVLAGAVATLAAVLLAPARSPSGPQPPSATSPNAETSVDDDRPVVTEPTGPAPEGMVWIPGGTFRLGRPDPAPSQQEEIPVHEVTLDGFWMAATVVTNRQFQAFVDATGYRTTAERPIDRNDLRGQVPDDVLASLPPEALDPSSICFNSDFD